VRGFLLPPRHRVALRSGAGACGGGRPPPSGARRPFGRAPIFIYLLFRFPSRRERAPRAGKRGLRLALPGRAPRRAAGGGVSGRGVGRRARGSRARRARLRRGRAPANAGASNLIHASSIEREGRGGGGGGGGVGGDGGVAGAWGRARPVRRAQEGGRGRICSNRGRVGVSQLRFPLSRLPARRHSRPSLSRPRPPPAPRVRRRHLRPATAAGAAARGDAGSRPWRRRRPQCTAAPPAPRPPILVSIDAVRWLQTRLSVLMHRCWGSSGGVPAPGPRRARRPTTPIHAHPTPTAPHSTQSRPRRALAPT